VAIVKSTFKKFRKWSSLPALVLFLILLVYNMIINPGFMKPASFFNYLLSSSPLLCIVMGMCVAKIVGGIDVSLGALLSLINVVMATLFTDYKMGIFEVVAIALGMGLVGGLINGIAIGVLRVNPLLATFATSSVYSGLALWIMPNPSGFGVPGDYIKFIMKVHFGFLPSCIILMAIPLLIWLIYMNSSRRISVYAIGRNETSAYISGMPVTSTKVHAHLFGGFCAAIGAIIATGLIASGDPTLGDTFALKAITAVVIGGVALSGGEGDIWGALFGGLFLTIILISIVGSTVETFSQNFWNYMIMIIGLILAVIVKRLSTRERKTVRGGNTQ
jgi:ribose transport system permease protein